MTAVPLATALLLGVLTGTAPARAQQESVAESLFRQAREEMKHGDPGNACPKFEESYRLDPSIGTLLNLGLCEEALGRTATAWTKLRQFVDSAPAGDSRLRLAQEKITKLETQLPWVRLVMDQGAEQALVQLDGVELRDASLSEAIPIDPGEHSITVSRHAGERNETRFQIHPAERLDLRLSLPPQMPAPEPAPASPPQPIVERPAPVAPVRAPVKIAPSPHDGNGERAGAYGLGAVGVVGLVTGSAFGLMALRDKSIVHEHCPNHECQDQTGLDAVESGNRNEIIADVAFAVGALGLASGAALWWHSGRTALSVGPNSAFVTFVGVVQ